MVNPSSHNAPNNMSGDVLIFGQMWICLTFGVRPGSLVIVTCGESIVLPYGSLEIMLFGIMTGSIFGVA